MYVCFQEASGSFGPRVAQQVKMNTPFNIYADASVSGKMTSSHVSNWAKHVFKLDVVDKSLLILDSWSGQKDENLIKSQLEVHNFKVEVIPPKSTKFIQPLDVYFFRQYKIIIRRIEEEIRFKCTFAENTMTKLNDRIFILKMHALVYNQFCAPSFQMMIKYAWQKCGYLTPEIVEHFDNVIDQTFNFDFETCSKEFCEEVAFIRCAYCNICLCIEHFFNYHYHEF